MGLPHFCAIIVFLLGLSFLLFLLHLHLQDLNDTLRIVLLPLYRLL
jgi:hypothetical protein